MTRWLHLVLLVGNLIAWTPLAMGGQASVVLALPVLALLLSMVAFDGLVPRRRPPTIGGEP